MNKNKKNIIFNCSLLIIHLLLIIPATSQKTTAQNTQPQTAVTCPKESISSQVPSAPTQPALGSRIPVREIKVLDSTVFNEKDFGTVTQPFAGRDLTLEETRQVADAVTQFYLNKGYINTRAVAVTPSNNGILQIRVIEGRLAEIEIQGLKRINRSYICNRIKLGAGIPFNTSHLEDQLKLLRLDPLFTNIEASLRPTGKVGQSILVVRVDEANPFTKSFTIDNYSPASVGAERLGISLLHRNLTGNGDELAAAYFRSFTGGSELYDFSYQIPVNARNGKLQFRIAPNRNEITQVPFNKLGIRAQQDVYEINYRQPLKRTPREEFALSLGFAYQSGQTFIFDQVATPFGIGPDPDGVSRTSVIKFSQDYTKRSPQGAWGVRSQFNFGTGLFDATTNASPIPDGQFFSWLGQAQRVQQLNLNNLLIVQADIQLTPNSLLPSQQFVIGGGQSIRGFRQNARSGDNGFRLAIEDRMTLKRNEGGIALIQVAPFIDMGTIWNHPDNPNKVPSQKFLASAGLGLLWNNAMGIDKLSLRLDYAIPFIDLKDKGSNIQDEGFYFSLRYQP
jgi:hemolysin activation/secretion protein